MGFDNFINYKVFSLGSLKVFFFVIKNVIWKIEYKGILSFVYIKEKGDRFVLVLWGVV